MLKIVTRTCYVLLIDKSFVFGCQTTPRFGVVYHGDGNFTQTLRKICRNTGFFWSVFSCIWTETYPYFLAYGQNRWHTGFCWYTKKYGSENVRISAYFTRWNALALTCKILRINPFVLKASFVYPGRRERVLWEQMGQGKFSNLNMKITMKKT